jgi:O-antigen/teichoic acid export membrane protein
VSTEARSGRPIRGLATVVGDLSSVAGARLAVAVLSIAGSIATTHLLAPESYAVIAYMGVGATLMLVAGSGWTSAAVVRYGREELEHTAGMRRVVWARVAVTVPVLFGVIVLGVGLQAAGVLPHDFTWPFLWMTLAIGTLGVACDQMIVALEAFGRMRAGARAGTARQAMLLVGMLALLAAADGARRPPESVAWLIFAVTLVLTAGLAWVLRGHGLWPPRLDRVQLRRILRFSLPLVAFSASQYVISSIDIVVLSAFRPAAEVGTYALAYSGYATLASLAASLTVVLIPLLVSLRVGGRSELIVRYFERLVPSAILLACTVGGLLAPIGALLIPVVFGAGFEGAAEPFAILVAAAVMMVVASLVAPIVMLHERTGATATISVGALAVNVVGDLVLVGWVGMGGDGPALATTAAIALTAFGYIIVARHDLGVRPALSLGLWVPLVAGIVPAVMGSAGLGLVCAAAGAALVLAVRPPFDAGDADLVARLDLPSRPVRLGRFDCPTPPR